VQSGNHPSVIRAAHVKPKPRLRMDRADDGYLSALSP
jgi:hypothetical protein